LWEAEKKFPPFAQQLMEKLTQFFKIKPAFDCLVGINII